MFSKILKFYLFFAVSVTTVCAQNPVDPSRFNLRDGTVDLAVPESPAFSALGLTPQQVTRPTTGRELATSLLNGVDRQGNFQTGIAIDLAPYLLLAGSQITLRKYQERNQYLTRFLSRMQTSFATSKGAASEDKSVKIALGWRFTFIDLGDPRTDSELLECLEREARKVLDNSPPIPPGTSEEAIAIENQRREASVRTAVEPCREAAAKRRWNRTAWVVGVAPTWTSLDGTSAQMEFSGTALWTSIGFGFEGVPVLEDHAMLAAYVKGRTKEQSPDRFQEDAFVTQNTITTGGRFILGLDTTHINIEGLWVRNTRPDNLEDRYWNIGFGLERKLVDNIWLDLSFGRELSRSQSDNAIFVMGSFNWGFAKK
jgi:hypothetical protein